MRKPKKVYSSLNHWWFYSYGKPLKFLSRGLSQKTHKGFISKPFKLSVYLSANLGITILAHLVIMNCHWIISLRSAIVFQTIVSEILSDLVNDLGVLYDAVNNTYSRRGTLSTPTVTNNYPLLKLTWYVTRACCLLPLVFLKVWVIVPFLQRRPQVFPTGWSHNELIAICLKCYV